jgi:hypothetical protein
MPLPMPSELRVQEFHDDAMRDSGGVSALMSVCGALR